jgi:hypothetical protein
MFWWFVAFVEKTDYVFDYFVQLSNLALPDHQRFPTNIDEIGKIATVPLYVALKLALPEFRVRFRY